MSWKTANVQPNRTLDFAYLEPSEAQSYAGNMAEVDVLVLVNVAEVIKQAGYDIPEIPEDVQLPIGVLGNVSVREGRKEGELWVNVPSTFVRSEMQSAQQQEDNDGKPMYLDTWTPVAVTGDSFVKSYRTMNRLSAVVSALFQADEQEDVPFE